jgi:hypothetical protein
MANAVNKVLVTNVTAANTGTSIPTIIDGDVLIFNRTWGTALTGSPTVTSAEGNDTIYIALGQTTGNMKIYDSGPIVVKNVTAAKLSTYVAPTEKVMTIAAGTATIADNSEYEFDVQYLNSTYRVHQQKPMAERYNYITSNNASQEELFFAMGVRAGNDPLANLYRKVEVTATDGTYTASSGGSATMTQYSDTFTIVESAGGANDAGKYAADASDMAVGDILAIGGTAAGTSLYKITAVSGVGTALATITISEVYQGASGAVTATNLRVVTAITSYNLKVTGIAIAPVPTSNPIDLYTKVDFTTRLFEIDGPVVPEFTPTISTALQMGTGFWEQVRDLEFLAAPYAGNQNRTMWPGNFLNPVTHAVSGYQYDLLTISHFEKNVDGLHGRQDLNKTTTIAFKSDVTTKRAEVINILESLFESVGVFVE